MEEETKKCPYCGEEILAIARKCKYCGEWLDKKETKPCPICGEQVDIDASVCPHCNENISHQQQKKVEPLFSSEDILYCKCCNKPINKHAASCPQCGESDPFYFSELRYYTKKTRMSIWFLLILAFFIILVTQAFGAKGGLLNPDKTQAIIIFVVLGIIYILRELFLWGLLNEKEEKIKEMAIKNNDKDLTKRWNEISRDIVKSIWF